MLWELTTLKIIYKNVKMIITGALSIQQQKIETLMDLGLTLQESRVYCALVENGPSKVES